MRPPSASASHSARASRVRVKGSSLSGYNKKTDEEHGDTAIETGRMATCWTSSSSRDGIDERRSDSSGSY